MGMQNKRRGYAKRRGFRPTVMGRAGASGSPNSSILARARLRLSARARLRGLGYHRLFPPEKCDRRGYQALLAPMRQRKRPMDTISCIRWSVFGIC